MVQLVMPNFVAFLDVASMYPVLRQTGRGIRAVSLCDAGTMLMDQGSSGMDIDWLLTTIEVVTLFKDLQTLSHV